MTSPGFEAAPVDRRLAVVAALSLFALGLAGVVQVVVWGADPLWGFVIVPPVAFFVVLAWIAFKTDQSTEEVTG